MIINWEVQLTRESVKGVHDSSKRVEGGRGRGERAIKVRTGKGNTLSTPNPETSCQYLQRHENLVEMHVWL